MSKNALSALVGALVVLSVVLGYLYYQSQQEPSGVQINLGNNGVSITTKK